MTTRLLDAHCSKPIVIAKSGKRVQNAVMEERQNISLASASAVPGMIQEELHGRMLRR